MSKLIPDIYTVTLSELFDAINVYVLEHLPCIAQKYAVLFDEDGSWCSLCEPEQFAIALEEQTEKMRGS